MSVTSIAVLLCMCTGVFSSGGFRGGGKGGALRLLFSSFRFVPIIIFTLQHQTNHLELVSNALSVKFVVDTHLNSMESKRVVPFQLFYIVFPWVEQ